MIKILRIGHRFERDKRVSTHLALVARAFGASAVIFDVVDETMKRSVEEVNKRWGGDDFRVEFAESAKEVIENFEGVKVHLTMYGININDKIDDIKSRDKDMLVIVGCKKVPPYVYHAVDYNIAIGSQPHSEVAALAVFMDRFFNGSELEKEFEGCAIQKIIPQEHGKKVIVSK